MAEADKSQMDEEVRRALSGFKNLEWHTRTGAPHCVTDLESVAAGQAQTIILLHPELAQVSFVVSSRGVGRYGESTALIVPLHWSQHECFMLGNTTDRFVHCSPAATLGRAAPQPVTAPSRGQADCASKAAGSSWTSCPTHTQTSCAKCRARARSRWLP